MEIEITWVDPSLVVCRPIGVAEVKGYEEFLQTLASSQEYGPEVKVLMDITALDVSSLTAADLEELASLRVRFSSERKARAAMVVGHGSPLRFGLGRMFEGFLASQAEFEVKVFEDLDQAMVWLQTGDPGPAS
jgi:hypothetical protein